MEKYQNKYCYLGIGLGGCYASYLADGYDAKVSIYCTIWRRLGARIGQRVNKNIVWEDGEIEEILPESERFKSY